MAGRPKIHFHVNDETSKHIAACVREVERYLGPPEADGEETGSKQDQLYLYDRQLAIKKRKLFAVQYAAQGGRSHQQIAKDLGCATSSVARWLLRFRQGGGDKAAVYDLLRVWRHRHSPVRDLRVLVPFAKAARDGVVTNPKGAADWFNAHCGELLRVKITPCRAWYWLDRLQEIKECKATSDEELTAAVLKIREMRPVWQRQESGKVAGSTKARKLTPEPSGLPSKS